MQFLGREILLIATCIAICVSIFAIESFIVCVTPEQNPATPENIMKFSGDWEALGRASKEPFNLIHVLLRLLCRIPAFSRVLRRKGEMGTRRSLRSVMVDGRTDGRTWVARLTQGSQDTHSRDHNSYKASCHTLPIPGNLDASAQPGRRTKRERERERERERCCFRSCQAKPFAIRTKHTLIKPSTTQFCYGGKKRDGNCNKMKRKSHRSKRFGTTETCCHSLIGVLFAPRLPPLHQFGR